MPEPPSHPIEKSHGYHLYLQQEARWRDLALSGKHEGTELLELHAWLMQLEEQLLRFEPDNRRIVRNCEYRLEHSFATGLKMPQPDWKTLEELSTQLAITARWPGGEPAPEDLQ